MRFRTMRLARLIIVLVWSLVVFPGTEISRASCDTTFNNQGPYYTLHCFDDEDCNFHDQSLTCQEEDCENCLGHQTGYSQFCVEYYDCGTIQGCSYIVCT